MSLRFRTPTTDDLDAVLAVINDPHSVHRRTDCRHGEVMESVSHLYDRLDEDENLVAIDAGGQVVGFASWQTYGRHAHLNVLAVAGAAQRMGVGRRLFEAFQARLREDGLMSYSLRAYRDSEWAIAFYAARGLAPVADVATLTARDAGFRHYVATSAANGQWPAPEKVVFFGALS